MLGCVGACSVAPPKGWGVSSIALDTEGGRTLTQRMLPSAAALAAADAAADADAGIEWRLPGRLTASATSARS